MSPRKNKSSFQEESFSSENTLDSVSKNVVVSVFEEMNRFSSIARLSYLTSVRYTTSPYSASTSSRNNLNKPCFSFLVRRKLTIETMTDITRSNSKTLLH